MRKAGRGGRNAAWVHEMTESKVSRTALLGVRDPYFTISSHSSISFSLFTLMRGISS